MRSTLIIAAIVLLSVLYFPACTTGSARLSAYGTDRGGASSFYLSVGEYYGFPERDVYFIRDRRVPDDEIPVVCFIAQRAHVAPSAVLDLRSRGESWMDISLHFGLTPDVYYVPVTEVYGSTYDRAYGYYRSRPRTEWNSIRLSDADVVNFVNLRFVSDHYGYSAPQVMKMRDQGHSFVKINDEARSWKHGKGRDNDRGRGNGKHRGEGNDGSDENQ